VSAPPPPIQYAPPQAPLSALLETRWFAALDKPAGLLTVPGRAPALADSLESRARARWGWARVAHRLDLGTSGVVLTALTPPALSALQRQFAERRVRKTYVALVHGAPKGEEGEVDLPLRCDWPNRPRQIVAEDGKPARTLWRVLAREGAATRVALTPVTGRSHQLRVHMAALGHPILGDPFYGDAASAPRLMLHAARLSFRDPETDAERVAGSPVPF
jgi:Pseudouridylate synthases, 23S RNA-specific